MAVASDNTNEAQVQILESRGGDCAGFQASRGYVEVVCEAWSIPAAFLRQVVKPGALPCFAYLLEKQATGGLEAVNVCFRWGPGHSNFLIFFGRFDSGESTLMAFVSSRDIIHQPSILDLLTNHAEELADHPLRLFGLLLEQCERYVDTHAQERNRRMLAIARSLRVVDDAWLQSWNIKPSDYATNSSGIYGAYDSTNWLLKNCGELVEIGKAYLKLVDRVEATTTDKKVSSLPREDVQSVVHRAALHAELLGYVAKMLESQFGFYSNLLQQEQFSLLMGISRSSKNIAVAAQRDSISMKTVSYLTMVFLPATFVSAICSTTVFDFQLWDGGKENGGMGVTSGGWWVFVLCCGVVTAVTLSVWFWFQRVEVRKGLVEDEEQGRGR
ncbi:hypothetical protein GE09DRAFT_1270680 [Coniochaeta sp. 2T2.1]|nr:hypothetical protein GE09DRAFT_1270680 [Coniochaeta sp. 2T2.1]